MSVQRWLGETQHIVSVQRWLIMQHCWIVGLPAQLFTRHCNGNMFAGKRLVLQLLPSFISQEWLCAADLIESYPILCILTRLELNI